VARDARRRIQICLIDLHHPDVPIARIYKLRLGHDLADDGQIQELWGSIEDLRHRCPRGFQSLLASPILLARARACSSLSKTTNM
jgi:hypothetical protein